MPAEIRASMRQLIFDLPHKTSFRKEDYLVSNSNAAAFGLIERWPRWPGQVLVLVGPAGAGKSHLAAIWAARAGAGTLAAAALAGADLPALGAAKAVLVEDLEGLTDEAALFHLINLLRERDGTLLLTAASDPLQWPLVTPDLRSRLRLAATVTIEPPDDALVRAVLVKLFVDRQLDVDADVVAYLALRIERSLGAAGAVVQALDREALTRGRRITRPMAADVLRAMHFEEE